MNTLNTHRLFSPVGQSRQPEPPPASQRGGLRARLRHLVTSTVASAAAACLTLGLIGAPRDSSAAGLLIADGGFGGVLEIEEHDVQVTINNGVAVTNVTQVFRNTENRIVEALYTFPVPKGASVSNFSMWIAGKEMIGEVLEKERAREIYNSYKQVRRDPGLLEQIDYKTFEMRIFPIAANAEQRVQITYYQELDFDHDWATYVYPLATATRENIDQTTRGRFALSLDVKSEIPIETMTSPSHGKEFVMVEHTDNYHQASLEATGGDLSRDLVVAFQSIRPRTGIDMITSRPDGEDGYFMLTLTAGEELKQVAGGGMDYVFLLDISGSMQNSSKLATSRRSVESFIEALSPEDRFDVITFNVAANTLFNGAANATPEARQQATEFLAGQTARGGTVLRPALGAAYKYADPDRQLNVVILSDGMTEQAERRELVQLIGQRPENVRVFAIGVGNEVNRPLLQQMARDAGGLAAFISRGDDFDRQAKAFRRKLTRPVATNLAMRFEGIETYDIEPRVLPNLYHGAPIRIYGRYRGAGDADVVLTGEVMGRELEKNLDIEFERKDGGNPEIERMWAWHRIQELLDQRGSGLAGDEILDQIVTLGETYSIVTEYTSFLVLENDAEYKRWNIARRNLRRTTRDRAEQQRLREELDRLRLSTMDTIGPVAAAPKPPQPTQLAMRQDPAQVTQPTAPTQRQVQQSPQRQSQPQPRRNSRDIDFGFGGGGGGGGGGALDPITAGLALLLGGGAYAARRRKEDEDAEITTSL